MPEHAQDLVTLTQVKPTQKGRLALFLEGEFAFSADLDTYARYHLCTGQRYPIALMEEVRQESSYQQAKEAAFRLLAYKSYTTAMLRQRLERDYDPECVQRVLERAEELGLLDDRDYALRLSRDLVRVKKWGLIRVEQELRRRGLGPQEVQEALEQFEELDVDQRIAQVVDRKYRSAIQDEKGLRRTVNGLLRLGYEYSDISRVLQNLREDPDYYNGPQE